MKKQLLAQSDNYKAIVSIPGWAEYLNSGGGNNKVSSPSDAYLYVPLMRRALNLRMSAIKSVPWHLENLNGNIIENGDFPVEFQSIRKETFRTMLGKTEAGLCLVGNCLWKKRNDAATRTRAVQWLNPNAVEPRLDEKTQEIFYQYNGTELLTQEDVISFNRFNPVDDVRFGGNEGTAALANAKLMFWLAEFSGQFFEHGAMPVTLLGIPTGTSNDERDRLEGWFRKRMQGIRNAFKALAVRTGDGGVEINTLTQNIKDMAMPDLYEQAKQSIADAFEIPHTMLDDAANFATAKEHRVTFWHDVMRPEGDDIADIINDQLLSQYNMQLVFDWDMMDQFQEDEEARSAAFFNYVGSKAVPPSVAAEMLGLELPVEYDELDEWYREQTIERPMILDQQDTTDEDEIDNPRKFNAEVQKWRRRVLKRLKVGKPANSDRKFTSDVIPALLIETTEAQLENADEVKANLIFDSLKEWKGYP